MSDGCAEIPPASPPCRSNPLVHANASTANGRCPSACPCNTADACATRTPLGFSDQPWGSTVGFTKVPALPIFSPFGESADLEDRQTGSWGRIDWLLVRELRCKKRLSEYA